jgi:hypothetical protein
VNIAQPIDETMGNLQSSGDIGPQMAGLGLVRNACGRK